MLPCERICHICAKQGRGERYRRIQKEKCERHIKEVQSETDLKNTGKVMEILHLN